MYRVQLENFEGPLDLLLFFIKRDELDIYDIPISYITEQFLSYIHFMDELDLSVASEFILMASTLMAIKVKMMLPQPEMDEDEFSEDDPRFELVQSLLEYKRYKEMATEMNVLDHAAREKYYRGFTSPDQLEHEHNGETLKEITLLDLIAAFKHILADKPEVPYHNIGKYETSIETQSDYVIDSLRKRGRLSFISLCEMLHSRLLVVVTFLAILEMVKEQQIVLYVSEESASFELDLPVYNEES
ncbi:MAG: segregation/condensation protein A [Balneolales bacterium]